MATAPLHTILHHLRRLVGPPSECVTDAQLLERFVSQRDEAAFELLVRRHERMVLNVCRRVLHDVHDTEDAFQATFLTLVRKANAIGKRQAVASWLYKVAYRVALRLQATMARRSALEQGRDDVPVPTATDDPATTALWRELRPLLDREISRLPEKYHVPVVLCYLEGKTYEEAARQLGCSRGTVSIRLTRARDILRRRLVRRGVTLSTAVLGSVLTEQTMAATVPVALVNATVQAAILFRTGPAAALGLVSTKVVSLTKGVLQTMFLTKLKTAAAIVMTAAVLGSGVGWLACPSWAARSVASGDATAEGATQIEAEKAPEPEPPSAASTRDAADLLRQLEKQSAAIESLVLQVSRLEKDKIVQHTMFYKGTFKYRKPNQCSLELRLKSSFSGGGGGGMMGSVYDGEGSEDFERTIHNGSEHTIYQIRSDLKQIQVTDQKATEPLRNPYQLFCFDFTPTQLEQCYDVKLVKEDRWYYYLNLLARFDKEKFPHRQVRLVLTKETLHLRQVWYEDANGKTTTWDLHEQEKAVIAPEELTAPTVPKGWRVVWPNAANGKPEKEDKSIAGPPRKVEETHDQLDKLLVELVQSKRSDEQVMEALCLATLARFPTDTEKKFALNHVAQHKERLEAFARVLQVLTSSEEFHAHAQALSKRSPQRTN
jgi:RNA polymerase sigma factor (sigma-70 family)